MAAQLEYRGGELATMASATKYYEWILSYCRPYLGRVVLEHGAGVGTVSSFLLAERIEQLVAVEPAANLVPELERRLAPWGRRASVWPHTLERFAALDHPAIDTIVSVNVLEHIADDRAVLATMARLLPARGHLVLFVPALRWLYGSLDRGVDHVRRYGRAELRDKVAAAGFRVVDVRFLNLLGVVTWFVCGRVLRQRAVTPASVRVFDRWVVPLLRRVERGWWPPIGQNLLLIAEREP